MMTERGAGPPSTVLAPPIQVPRPPLTIGPRAPIVLGGPPRPHHSQGPRPPSNGSLPVNSVMGPRPSPVGGPRPGMSSMAGGPQDDSDKGLKMKIKRTKSGRQEIVNMKATSEESEGEGAEPCSPVRQRAPSPPAAPQGGGAGQGGLSNGVASQRNGTSPANKRLKVDAGTCTDASTLTEPDSLGPCDPGTAVNLEGIVWQETDTGVLVVNVTWRGKTYVGTLLDCTRHTNQWSAPRFTDSPEPGGKGGRGKRGRSNTAGTSNEVEPRKNLRSSNVKGKGKGKAGKVKEDEFNFPAPSSPAKDSGKRKSRPDDVEEAKKRKRNAGSDQDQDDDKTETEEEKEEEEEATPPPAPVQRREPRPVVYSYTMMECPRKDCNKQYKEEDGLKWHLSHSHPEYIDSNGQIKDSSTVEREQEERKRRARARREAKAEGTPLQKAVKVEGGAKLSTPSRPSSRPAATSTPAAAPRLPGQLPAGLIAKTKVLEPAVVTIDSGRSSTVSSPVPCVSPPASQEKPPASSPAYSDISDDGEDSRGSREMFAGVTKTPVLQAKSLGSTTSLSTPSLITSSLSAPALSTPSSYPRVSTPSSYPRVSTPSSYPRVSTPSSFIRASTPSSYTRATTPSSYTSSRATTPSSYSLTSSTPSRPTTSMNSPSLNSPSCGPAPGTPEYHKYLAANGFPPFPYPYPVGMDPNYHVQLLKTDHVYKMKWEKDRAEREKAFKEQLDRDQGKFSGLSLIKEEKLAANRKEKASQEEARKRENSGGRNSGPSPSLISVKAEFREKDEVKREVKLEDQGVKPTMETRGPPPGPQTFGYMHPSLLRPGMPPYSMPPGSMGMPPHHFDPIMASAMMGSASPYGLPPYMSPGMAMPRPPGPFSFPGDPLRSPFSLPSPEEMARAGALPGGPPGSMSGTKALDLLQQHASQYYANQKLAELQERALKSPSSSLASPLGSMSSSASPGLQAAKPVTTMAGKDSPTPSSAGPDKAKSPPPLRHVHTHTHTHIGLGYPLLPPVPGALPAGAPGLPPGALPPPTVGVSALPPGAPFPPSPYPGKSP